MNIQHSDQQLYEVPRKEGKELHVIYGFGFGCTKSPLTEVQKQTHWSAADMTTDFFSLTTSS